MKLMTICAVEVLSNYTVRLEFSNGVQKVVDLEMYLHGPIFEPMRNDYTFFQSIQVDHESGTIVWPNGADCDPNVLYYDHLKPAWMREVPLAKAA